MDQDVLTQIVIDRPRSEVADYVSDPENATEWSQHVSKAEWKSPKPLSAGSEFAFEARVGDEKRAYTYQVTEYVPGESLVMSSESGSSPMETRYRFSDTDSGGTKIELRNVMHDPDLASALEIDNRQDLARLKSILEDGGS
jgi:uncharacterized protein YndB with AHSA1/START domain